MRFEDGDTKEKNYDRRGNLKRIKKLESILTSNILFFTEIIL